MNNSNPEIVRALRACLVVLYRCHDVMTANQVAHVVEIGTAIQQAQAVLADIEEDYE